VIVVVNENLSGSSRWYLSARLRLKALRPELKSGTCMPVTYCVRCLMTHLPGRLAAGMCTFAPVLEPTAMSAVSSASRRAGIAEAGYVPSASVITIVSWSAALIPVFSEAP